MIKLSGVLMMFICSAVGCDHEHKSIPSTASQNTEPTTNPNLQPIAGSPKQFSGSLERIDDVHDLTPVNSNQAKFKLDANFKEKSKTFPVDIDANSVTEVTVSITTALGLMTEKHKTTDGQTIETSDMLEWIDGDEHAIYNWTGSFTSNPDTNVVYSKSFIDSDTDKDQHDLFVRATKSAVTGEILVRPTTVLTATPGVRVNSVTLEFQYKSK